MSEKAYAIRKIDGKPVFVITWGEINTFSPNDDKFVQDVRHTLDAFGQNASVIMDTTNFHVAPHNAMGSLLQEFSSASKREDTIPKHPLVKQLIFVTKNRFIDIIVGRICQQHVTLPISIVPNLDTAIKNILL